MRQIQRAPFGIVEPSFAKAKISGLGKDLLILAKAQVVGRIVGVAKLKLPAKIEEQSLARCDS